MTFEELPIGTRFYLSGICREKISPARVGPQVFNTALVDSADELLLWGDDAGPGPPYRRIPPYIPRSSEGRALHTTGPLQVVAAAAAMEEQCSTS